MSPIIGFNAKEFFIKILIVCIGVLCASCGIALFYALNIGTDPISVFVDGQHRIFGLSYGAVNLIDSIIYLIIIFILSRNLIRLATLITSFAMGPLINLFSEIFGRIILSKGSLTFQFFDFQSFVFIPPEGDFILRLLLLIPAIILLGFGLGLYLSANMGASPIDALVLIIAGKSQKPINKIKIAFDFTAAAIGFLLGGVVGIGTILAIAMTGPMIGFTIKIMNKKL